MGVILSLKNPRYSNKVKGGITAGIIFLFLFYRYSTCEPPPVPVSKQESSHTQSYDVGCLRQSATWEDDRGRSHKNSKRVKIEVPGNTIVSADGGRLQQIYFLEGSNAGAWGYVTSGSISK